MRKSDLKTGMLLVNREGKYSLVMLDTPDGDVYVAGIRTACPVDQTYGPLRYFDENLLHKSVKNSDIVRVYGYSNNSTGAVLSIANRSLLWERKEANLRLNENCTAIVISDMQEVIVSIGSSSPTSPEIYSFEELKPLFDEISSPSFLQGKILQGKREVSIRLPEIGSAGRTSLVTAFKEIAESIGWEYNSEFNKWDKLLDRDWLYFSDTWQHTPGKRRFSLTSCSEGIDLSTNWNEAVKEIKEVFENLGAQPTRQAVRIKDRTVEVDHDKKEVKIGCQTFSFDVLLELSKLINKK